MSKSKDRYLTIEEIVSLPQISEPTISNNGQQVAFVKKTANWDGNAYSNHVWLYDKTGVKSYPITTGKMESSHPRWSPDARQLAYLSPVGEGEKKVTQLFIQSIDGSQGIQVSHVEQSVESFKWTPDGKGFFYIAKAPESEEMEKRKEIYGSFEYIDQEYQRNCLYYLDLQKGLKKAHDLGNLPKDLRERERERESESESESEVKSDLDLQLTNGLDFHIYQFDISPNGKTVVFSAAPTPNIEDIHKQELYLLDVQSQKLTHVKTKGPIGGGVIFSYDGSKICYPRYMKDQAFFNNSTLEVYSLQTEETTQPLVELDENIKPVRWIDNGIVIEWQERTTYIVGLLSEGGELTLLTNGEDSVAHSSSITEDGQHIAYVKATSTEPAEVYLDDTRITDQNKYYEGKLLSQKEVIRWNSTDGLEIEGILSTPPSFDPSKKYPLVVVIHGGPTAASFAIPTSHKYYPIEQFVEKGFIVLEPNYRGSSGYGEAFRKANYRKLGVGDYDDVISGVDALIDIGTVDKDKVGVMGWSQGGYISAFCSTYSDRFKAISVGAGISNWMTYYVNTDIHQFTRMYLGDTPWNDEEIYRKTSPMTYIKSACTPTLIQHGEKDVRVPVPNAYELYQGLRDVGVQTELVIFKGMGHGSDKPGFNRAILKQNLVWFCHHIMGESMDGFRV